MSSAAILLLAFLVTFICLWRIITKSSKSITEWPVVGMLPALLWRASTDLHGFATRVLEETGGTFIFKGPWFADMDFVFTTDPMNAHHVFSRNFANYGKGDDFRAIFEELFGEGIVNMDGEAWKFQRQRIHSFLSKDEFESYVMGTLRRKTEGTLFRVLDAFCSERARGLGGVIDVQDVVNKFMFDNICMWVLGFDPGYLTIEDDRDSNTSTSYSCGQAFDEIEEVVIYRHIVPRGVWEIQRKFGIGSEKKIHRGKKVLDEFVYDVVKTKKQGLQHKEDRRQLDLLTQWLVADEKGGKSSSDKYLRDIVVTLVGAGRDTVSSALNWLLWLVATHPQVEKKILEEIERVVETAATRGGGGGVLMMSKDEMNRLVYLHATICETLRLYPPAPFESRCAIEADVLPSGHVVSKGTRILFSIYSMGRMEEIWGRDCMEFKPERWISGQGGSIASNIVHVPSHKFVTFLTGPRACLGKLLSFMQLKFMVSNVLWRYKFDVVEGHVVKPVSSIMLSMEGGLKMRVSKRDHDV